MSKDFFTYILKCSDGTFYCGFTTDVYKRVKTHNSGTGAKYTRSRLPVELVYTECFRTKSDALSREYKIKHMTREQKMELILQKEK